MNLKFGSQKTTIIIYSFSLYIYLMWKNTCNYRKIFAHSCLSRMPIESTIVRLCLFMLPAAITLAKSLWYTSQLFGSVLAIFTRQLPKISNPIFFYFSFAAQWIVYESLIDKKKLEILDIADFFPQAYKINNNPGRVKRKIYK